MGKDMIRPIDFFIYEWRQMRIRNFFSRRSVKYLLLVMAMMGIYTGNKIILAGILALAVWIKFLDDYNNEEFLAYRNKKYGFKDSKEKMLYKWMGIKKKDE